MFPKFCIMSEMTLQFLMNTDFFPILNDFSFLHFEFCFDSKKKKNYPNLYIGNDNLCMRLAIHDHELESIFPMISLCEVVVSVI